MKVTVNVVLESVKTILATIFTLDTLRGGNDWSILKSPTRLHTSKTTEKYKIHDRCEVCKHCLIEEYFLPAEEVGHQIFVQSAMVRIM